MDPAHVPNLPQSEVTPSVHSLGEDRTVTIPVPVVAFNLSQPHMPRTSASNLGPSAGHGPPVHDLGEDRAVNIPVPVVPFNPSLPNTPHTSARINTSNLNPSAGNVPSYAHSEKSEMSETSFLRHHLPHHMESPPLAHLPKSNPREARINNDNDLSSAIQPQDWIVPTVPEVSYNLTFYPNLNLPILKSIAQKTYSWRTSGTHTQDCQDWERKMCCNSSVDEIFLQCCRYVAGLVWLFNNKPVRCFNFGKDGEYLPFSSRPLLLTFLAHVSILQRRLQRLVRYFAEDDESHQWSSFLHRRLSHLGCLIYNLCKRFRWTRIIYGSSERTRAFYQRLWIVSNGPWVYGRTWIWIQIKWV